MVTESLELLAIYDYVVTDRTPLDCVSYEMANHEMATGSTEFTLTAATLYQYAAHFLQMQQAEILWVTQGYGFTTERGRTDHGLFKELSAKWFIETHKTASQDLPIRQVDLRELDLVALAKDLAQR